MRLVASPASWKAIANVTAIQLPELRLIQPLLKLIPRGPYKRHDSKITRNLFASACWGIGTVVVAPSPFSSATRKKFAVDAGHGISIDMVADLNVDRAKGGGRRLKWSTTRAG